MDQVVPDEVQPVAVTATGPVVADSGHLIGAVVW
jgi:hypothetical protein